ncbi:MAG: GNAT family N-acetyltransferase, partial [Candidatus Heimdallarchaeota archaeon]
MISFDLSSINIIIADNKDINEICRLNQDEYWDNTETVDEETQFRVGKWWIKNSLLRWHMSILKACGGNILVAKIGTEIIGELDYVQSNEYDKGFFSRLHIIWLLVKKEYRTLGIAKKMIEVLKSKFPQSEIWVEPEDDRSLQLYQSIGIRRKSIDTWKLNSKQRFLENFNYDLIEKLRLLDYKQLINLIKENKVSCIIGRYYAPSFDIEQLNQSDEVKRYIWGDTDKPSIIVCRLNNLTLYTVMTQYI